MQLPSFLPLPPSLTVSTAKETSRENLCHPFEKYQSTDTDPLTEDQYICHSTSFSSSSPLNRDRQIL